MGIVKELLIIEFHLLSSIENITAPPQTEYSKRIHEGFERKQKILSGTFEELCFISIFFLSI